MRVWQQLSPRPPCKLLHIRASGFSLELADDVPSLEEVPNVPLDGK